MPWGGYTHYDLGATATYKALSLDVRYVDTDLSAAQCVAFTAGKMIVNEKLLAPWFAGEAPANQAAYWGVCVLAIVGVLTAGWLTNRRKPGSERIEQAEVAARVNPID